MTRTPFERTLLRELARAERDVERGRAHVAEGNLSRGALVLLERHRDELQAEAERMGLLQPVG